jgi:magnesium-transporting ATPase (P-type)
MKLKSAASSLSEDEAARRWQQFWANELPEADQHPLWLRFAEQLTHFMALLLWVAEILVVPIYPNFLKLGRLFKTN